MTSLFDESRLTLKELARREGVSISTAWRWALHGTRGVWLETYSVGARRYTTREAFSRFVERSSLAAAGNQQPQSRTPKQRERDNNRADKKLARQGI